MTGRAFGRWVRDWTDRYGACPIEAGIVANLADNECPHGSLPGDRIQRCRCWERR